MIIGNISEILHEIADDLIVVVKNLLIPQKNSVPTSMWRHGVFGEFGLLSKRNQESSLKLAGRAWLTMSCNSSSSNEERL